MCKCRILSLVFESSITRLERRQTMLFSATQTKNVQDLARISLREAPLYVGVDDDKDTSTVDGLEQVGGHTTIYAVEGIDLHFQRNNSSLMLTSIGILIANLAGVALVDHSLNFPFYFHVLPPAGLCSGAIRDAIPAALHLPEAQQG